MFRLLELLGGLALITDLGAGAPMEESLKRAVLAVRLARTSGCGPEEVSDVLYTSLLQHLGCTAAAHEGAQTWGEDIAVTRHAFLTDFTDPKDVWRTYVHGLAESTGQSRLRVVTTGVVSGRKGQTAAMTGTCETARDAARRLGLAPSVQDALFHGLTMWNGHGRPRVAGELIPVPIRVTHVASVAAMFALLAGPEAACAHVRNRSGSYLDPGLADTFLTHRKALLAGLDEIDPYDELLDLEPDPVRLVAEEQVEEVARTFGDLADLKSPWLHGHSRGVAQLASGASEQLGLDEVRAVRIAGYLHDLGKVAVSSRIWDKPAPLTAAEREQARLHAYHGERVLARVPALAAVAHLVGRHHERLDGTGYHRGAGATQLTMPARVLAAADSYRSRIEDRPHRPAATAADAAAHLRREVHHGHLDGDAVHAVLAAAGIPTAVRRSRPAGLTDRQLEVLVLVAAGLSNKEIAQRLVISRRTAEHHLQDAYLKIGASSRAAAALFVMEHGLLDKPG
ncbi:HD domain-containing phosphohydrolase [Ornithinicoccus halotolerans]|uniref:HD domain-containing phosphohydrolase n=1 Tax=Ornithinicoccus halotolerans TaxID=1748220 RepID=UPI0012963624|nr:HD domain-containing phosphohydrolase [Ornithinicoccus halotolerans]